MFNNPKIIADNTVGYTKFFLVKKNSIIAANKTIILINMSDSANIPAGKMIILAVKAARIEYATQLNHLKIFDPTSIFFELKNPNNLDEYVATAVTKMTKGILFANSVIFSHLK